MKYRDLSNLSMEGLIPRGQYQHLICHSPHCTQLSNGKLQTQKATEPLKSCYSNIPSSICRSANCFMNTIQPKGLNKHPFTVYVGGEASSTGCVAGSDLCRAAVHLSLCTDLHPHSGFRIAKEEVYLEYFLLLPGGALFHLNVISWLPCLHSTPDSSVHPAMLYSHIQEWQCTRRVYTNQSQSTYKGLQAPAECPLEQGPVTLSQGQRLELSASTLSRNVSRRIKSLYHEVSASTAFLLLYH